MNRLRLYNKATGSVGYIWTRTNLRANVLITGIIGMIIAVIAWSSTTPVVVNQVYSTNTTTWNFTGSAGAASLYNLTPFLYAVGLPLLVMGTVFALSRRGD